MISLRQHRLSQILSIETLAAKAGVSNKTITDIEHGRVRPKLRTIRRLSTALGIAPQEISEFAAVIGFRPDQPSPRLVTGGDVDPIQNPA